MIAAMSPEQRILEQLVAYLVDHSESELSADEIETDVNFFDYGYLDSLGLAAFLAFVASKFDVRISDEDLVTRFTTLDSLAEHIASNSTEQTP